MKECKRCLVVKELTEFTKNSRKADGLCIYCKSCTRASVKKSYWSDAEKSRNISKQKRVRNAIEISKKSKEYYRINKDKINKSQAEYRNRPDVKEKTKKRIREWEQNKRQSDSKYVMTKNLRAYIRNVFKRYSKNGKLKTCKDYGIEFNTIFSKVGARPSENHELDHIIPITKFDLDNPEHVRLAHLPCNLQWLAKIDNKKKSNSIPLIAYENEELRSILVAIGLL